MSIDQLTGRYLRLKQELEIVDRRTPWRRAHIDRLAKDLTVAELQLGEAGLVDRREPTPLQPNPAS